jgi:hypothetical protein
MAIELSAFISRLMLKIKRPISAKLGLIGRFIFLPLLSEFYPPDKKDVCNNALNVQKVASISANICSWILQRNDL